MNVVDPNICRELSVHMKPGGPSYFIFFILYAEALHNLRTDARFELERCFIFAWMLSRILTASA